MSFLSGPPGFRIEDAYVQVLPINKQKCHDIDPVRDISYQLFTRYVIWIYVCISSYSNNSSLKIITSNQ